MEELDLEKIEKELEKISPWPWSVKIDEYKDWYLKNKNDSSMMCNIDYYPWTPEKMEDWDFIAKSPERIAALVKRVRELEAGVLEMRKYAQEIVNLEREKQFREEYKKMMIPFEEEHMWDKYKRGSDEVK